MIPERDIRLAAFSAVLYAGVAVAMVSSSLRILIFEPDMM